MTRYTRPRTRLYFILSISLGLALLNLPILKAEETAWKLPEVGPGVLNLDARLRYEYNGSDNATESINGLGLRTRLGYTWDWDGGVSSQVEVEDLHFVESDNRPGLDVPTTEVNQAWIDFEGIKIGRQVYTLDDHRFIGHVGWRQNIQSFDAATGSFKPDQKTQLNFGYLDSVNRVNATTQDLAGVIANGNRKISDALSLTAFAYLLDFEQTALTSSDTYGLRATGKRENDDRSLGYAISYAKQNDNSGSTTSFELDYLAGEITGSANGSTFAFGFEFLEGDGTSGFSTPLATVHKFNGFADQFAGASLGLAGGLSQGLRDYYLRYTGEIARLGMPIAISYHHFEAENLNDFLGNELDMVATYKLSDHAQIVSKYAYFYSDGQENVAYGGFDKTVFTFELNISY